ncbi:AMP-binding protein [Cytophagaceae bacterium ABcell3]|nr:AMP-binding protein [Cytophagaceae bacterium ABcell3]
MIPEIPEDFEYARNFCQAWEKGEKYFQINTSGSTGKPKPITLTRNQMEASAHMTAEALGLQKGDKILLCINTAYIGGLMMLVRAMVLDLELIISSPSSNPLHNIDPEQKLDFTALVPIQLENILKQSPEKIHILNNMKAIIVGGAPVNESLKTLSNIITAPVYNTYGMTETVSHIALKKINNQNQKSDIFTALKGVNLGQDHRGCLTISAPSTDYKQIITNDVVELISSDQFIWKGRADNAINTGGIKVHPEELEKKVSNILNEHEIPCHFFITSVPDDFLGEKIILVTEGKKEELETIGQLLKNKLGKYENPKALYNLNRFVYTKNDKINRIKTKELLFGTPGGNKE